jgi:hypothetical protein
VGGVYLFQTDGPVVYSVDSSIGMYYIGYLCIYMLDGWAGGWCVPVSNGWAGGI